jgi:hypothetical protein
MKQTIPAACFLAASAILAACGGSSGGSIPITPTNPPPTKTPGTTVAQGTLVDDPSGIALAGVTVRLDPWIAYPTPGPTPTPIVTATTDPSGHFTITARNGTYLLVIGPDAVNTPPPGWSTPPSDAMDTPIPGANGWRATIHDKVVLNGGAQVLIAPTMLPEPLYTPSAVETSGKYRLATLDALTEAPCILAYNQNRIALNLAPAVVDEWLTENTRDVDEAAITPGGVGDILYLMTAGWGHAIASGGANCGFDVVSGAFPLGAYSLDPQALWFGGQYIPYSDHYSAVGLAEFPVDPRILTPPRIPPWP